VKFSAAFEDTALLTFSLSEVILDMPDAYPVLNYRLPARTYMFPAQRPICPLGLFRRGPPANT